MPGYKPGDSRTGGHHIMTIAETMRRGLPPELVITMVSAHSAPTSGNEYKVVNCSGMGQFWLEGS